MTYTILPVQFTCLTVFLHNVFPSPSKVYLLVWSPLLNTFLHPTRMWANAQPDGRPAERSWRPLFNAAKFG